VDALHHPVGRGFEIEHQLGPQQRLHALAGGLLGKFQRPEQIVGVGDAKRRLLVGLGQIEQRAELQRALEQGILRVDVKVDEAWARRHR
jgi:hypothetical protein